MSYPVVNFLAYNWDAVLISIICFVLGLMYLKRMRGQAWYIYKYIFIWTSNIVAFGICFLLLLLFLIEKKKGIEKINSSRTLGTFQSVVNPLVLGFQSVFYVCDNITLNIYISVHSDASLSPNRGHLLAIPLFEKPAVRRPFECAQWPLVWILSAIAGSLSLNKYSPTTIHRAHRQLVDRPWAARGLGVSGTRCGVCAYVSLNSELALCVNTFISSDCSSQRPKA